MSYFTTRRTGDIERRLAGLRQVRRSSSRAASRRSPRRRSSLGGARADVRLQPELALVFLATVPLYAALMRFSRTRLRPMYDDLEEAYGEYPVAPDRRDPGHRDGQGDGRRAGAAPARCCASSRRSPTACSAPIPVSLPGRGAAGRLPLVRAVPVGRRARGHQRRPDASASSSRSTRWSRSRRAPSCCCSAWDELQISTCCSTA